MGLGIVILLLSLLSLPSNGLKQINLYSENFLLGYNNWTIQGNTNRTNNLIHQAYSIGPVLNRYVVGSEGLINVDHKRKDDSSLWYFTTGLFKPINVTNIPSLIISFNMYGFAGNFSDLNKQANPLVKLVGSNGITIQTKPNAYPFATHFSIRMDGLDKLKTIKQIYILGDWTRWYETIGLDNVEISTWI